MVECPRLKCRRPSYHPQAFFLRGIAREKDMDNISLTDEAGTYVTMAHSIIEGGTHQVPCMALLRGKTWAASRSQTKRVS